jgi:hypothetical protein
MFEKRWLPLIYKQKLLSDKTVIKPEIVDWFEYLYNEDNPQHSRYRCGICFRYAYKLRNSFQLNQSQPIISANGDLKESKEANRKTLLRHANNPVHKEIVIFVKRLMNGEQVHTYTNLLSTVYFVKSVFTLIKLHGSMDSIKHIYNLLISLDLPVSLSFVNEDGTRDMIKSISTFLHSDIIDELNVFEHPLGIIIDSATDKMLKHYLICNLSIMKNGKQSILFYRLIQINSKQDGNELFNLLIKAFTDDGIYDVIQRNLVAFIADGASVMNTVSDKFNVWVNKINNKTIVRVWCYGHRYVYKFI